MQEVQKKAGDDEFFALVSFSYVTNIASAPISSPEAAFLLVSTKDANLWDNPYQVPVKKQL